MQSRIPIFLRLLLVFPCVFHSAEAYSQEGIFEPVSGKELSLAERPEAFRWAERFFDDDIPLEIQLRAPFQALSAQKGEEGEYLPAEMIVNVDEQTQVRVNVRLKPRGYSRRKACAFPPLKVDFSHKKASLVQVRPLKDMKMVCHCRQGEDYERYILREYLVYRLFNLLTPLSFRVRLARVRFVEESSGAAFYTGFAFFIEEAEQLALRNQMELLADDRLSPEQTDRLQISRVSVFQFMIANLDWSVNRLHNVRLFRQTAAQAPLPAPYDFDLSGLVNAFYAERGEDDPPPPPPPGRVFQGHCRQPEEFEGIFQEFRHQKENFIQLIRGFPYLPEAERDSMVDFLMPFYKIIDSPQQVQSYFLMNCRK